MCSHDRALYTALGVAPGVEEQDLRQAYKRAALQCHPDRNPDSADAPAEFQRVARAFEVLSSPALRAAYDRDGLSAVEALEQHGVREPTTGRGFATHAVQRNAHDTFRNVFGPQYFHASTLKSQGRREASERERRVFPTSHARFTQAARQRGPQPGALPKAATPNPGDERRAGGFAAHTAHNTRRRGSAGSQVSAPETVAAPCTPAKAPARAPPAPPVSVPAPAPFVVSAPVAPVAVAVAVAVGAPLRVPKDLLPMSRAGTEDAFPGMYTPAPSTAGMWSAGTMGGTTGTMGGTLDYAALCQQQSSGTFTPAPSGAFFAPSLTPAQSATWAPAPGESC